MGAPFTNTLPSFMSRSSGPTSSIFAATLSIFCRISVAATCTAEPPMMTLREL